MAHYRTKVVVTPIRAHLDWGNGRILDHFAGVARHTFLSVSDGRYFYGLGWAGGLTIARARRVGYRWERRGANG